MNETTHDLALNALRESSGVIKLLYRNETSTGIVMTCNEVLDRNRVAIDALLNEPEKKLAKHQPCGCVICTCGDHVTKCCGCGAKWCGKHPVSQIPDKVYEEDRALNSRILGLQESNTFLRDQERSSEIANDNLRSQLKTAKAQADAHEQNYKEMLKRVDALTAELKEEGRLNLLQKNVIVGLNIRLDKQEIEKAELKQVPVVKTCVVCSACTTIKKLEAEIVELKKSPGLKEPVWLAFDSYRFKKMGDNWRGKVKYRNGAIPDDIFIKSRNLPGQPVISWQRATEHTHDIHGCFYNGHTESPLDLLILIEEGI